MEIKSREEVKAVLQEITGELRREGYKAEEINAALENKEVEILKSFVGERLFEKIWKKPEGCTCWEPPEIIAEKQTNAEFLIELIDRGLDVHINPQGSCVSVEVPRDVGKHYIKIFLFEPTLGLPEKERQKLLLSWLDESSVGARTAYKTGLSNKIIEVNKKNKTAMASIEKFFID